jgi:Citrate synthase, C-terminal domain
MLREIGSTSRIPGFIKRVKSGEARLMGFGQRVYKNYDPRARIVKRVAEGVFAETRPSPLLPVALELERIALQDDYFVTRRLYPNVDFYTGLIYEAMGLPVEMFPVLFAIPRTAGWLAQWAGDGRRPRAEDCSTAAALRRAPASRLRADGNASMSVSMPERRNEITRAASRRGAGHDMSCRAEEGFAGSRRPRHERIRGSLHRLRRRLGGVDLSRLLQVHRCAADEAGRGERRNAV